MVISYSPYTKGRGRGPGEITHVASFMGNDEEELWVLDSQNRRITFFGEEGQIRKDFSFNTRVYGAAVNTENQKIVTLSHQDSALFRFYEVSDDFEDIAFVQSGGKWIKDQETFGSTLRGQILSDRSKDAFYYISNLDGVIYASTFDGNLLFMRNTIDNQEFASWTNVPFGSADINGQETETWTEEFDFTVRNQMLNIHSDTLYVMALFTEFDESKDPPIQIELFIDAYSTSDGAYLESIQFLGNSLQGCMPLYVRADALYSYCSLLSPELMRYNLDRK